MGTRVARRGRCYATSGAQAHSDAPQRDQRAARVIGRRSRGTGARTRVAGPGERAAPEQVGQRAGPGQARADVEPHQGGQHGGGAERCDQRHQQQGRRRLLTRFASTVATSATSSSAASASPVRQRGPRRGRPGSCRLSAATTTPRQSTNTANAGCAARATVRGPRPPRGAYELDGSTSAAAAADPGRLPRRGRSRRRSRPASAASTSTGNDAAAATPAPRPRRSRASARDAGRGRRTAGAPTYSTAITTSHAGAISSAKPTNDRSSCGQREQVGQVGDRQQQEAELASRTQAYTAGRGRTPARRRPRPGPPASAAPRSRRG